jgi:hypothetical protein
VTAGQASWPRDTLDALLRDHERRITVQERRPQGPVVIEVSLVAVATPDDIEDEGLPYYVVSDGMVHVGPTTMTHAAWTAAL